MERAIPYDTASLETSRPGAAPQRARGHAKLVVRRRDAQSVISDLAMSGSAKLLFPRRSTSSLDAVMLNTAGGITGGDRFSYAATVEGGASVTLTTQAAERIYRASPGAPGQVRNHLEVADGATLHWLPQETILFDASALDRELSVTLAPGGRLLACECLIFGRKAMGEDVRQVYLRDRMDLRQNGKLVFSDRLRLDGDAQTQLDLAAVAGGARAMASVLIARPGASALIETLRQMLPECAGASAITEDLVFLRIVAPDGFMLRETLVPVLQELADGPIPKTWMI